VHYARVFALCLQEAGVDLATSGSYSMENMTDQGAAALLAMKDGRLHEEEAEQVSADQVAHAFPGSSRMKLHL
jgi:hypothetical protein